MKKWISIITILVVIVLISGCASKQSLPNTKNYSANGLSFNYPGNWSEMDTTFYQSVLGDKGQLLVVVGDGSNSAFGVAKLKDEKNQTLKDLVITYKLSLKSNGTEYVSEKPVTIGAVKGYEITVKASGNYFSSILFIKNNSSYLVVFESQNNDQQTFDQIVKSLNVN